LVGGCASIRVPAAWAGGYDAYVDGASCVNADGAGCTRTGSDHTRTVMRCAAGTAGSFDCPLTITSDASSGLTVKPGTVEIVNASGNSTNDNLCYSITTYVITDGTVVAAAMSGGTESGTVSDGVTSAGCHVSGSACHVGSVAIGAVAAYDLTTGANCNAAECTDRQAWVRVKWKAACAGAVSTGNWDFPFLKFSVQ
jgi:hypothetical protein